MEVRKEWKAEQIRTCFYERLSVRLRYLIVSTWMRIRVSSGEWGIRACGVGGLGVIPSFSNPTRQRLSASEIIEMAS